MRDLCKEYFKGYIMKIYITAFLIILASSPAFACIHAYTDEELAILHEAAEVKFTQYDLNKDGYIDSEEWKKSNLKSDFLEVIKVADEDNDKKLSKNEFSIIYVNNSFGMFRVVTR